MGHIHSVYDTDKHFTIDPDTRVLVNQNPNKNSIMQGDHNSERITFDLPRMVDGHDMTTCNRVEIHYLNTDAYTKNSNPGLYPVEDLKTSPADEDIVVFSWLISREATQLVGPLAFRVTFHCVSGDAPDYSWSTAVYKGLSVSDGINNSEWVAEEYADILEQWRKQLFDGVGGSGGGNVDLSDYLKKSELSGAVDTALERAKASGDFDGATGPQGPKGETGATGATGAQGPQGPAGADGAKGDKGDKGDTGATGSAGTSVTVKSVSESTADGGSNVITFSDGKTITIKNGKTGSQGPAGADGAKGDKGDTGAQGPKGDKGDTGPKGADGDDYVLTDADKTAIAELASQMMEVPEGGSGTRGPGILQVSTTPSSYTTATGGQNPAKRMKLATIMSEASVSEVLVGDAIRHSYYLYPIYYVDATYAYTKSGVSIRGASGSAGSAGKDGTDGQDGYTPVRGTDYWTTADQDAIIQQVIAAMGGSVFGSVDANNNIILTGILADGTYTIKYENEDGTVTEIGTIEVGAEPLPTSGYAEMTWYDGVKLDKTNGSEGTGTGYCASSHVEIWDGYTYTAKQTMYDGSRYGGVNVVYYDANGSLVSCTELWVSDSNEHSVVLTPPANAVTFRLRVYYGTVYKPGMWPVYFEKTA